MRPYQNLLFDLMFIPIRYRNVRQVLNENGDILQETEYYPFGLAIPRSGTDAINKYQYNGKEKQPETGWLDYGARMYDPSIARWGVVDGVADLFEDVSPYVYGLNSPMMYVDPSGDTTIHFNDLPVTPYNPKTDVVLLDDAVVKGKRSNTETASMEIILPGSLLPTRRPGPIPIPRAAPLLIPVAYSALASICSSQQRLKKLPSFWKEWG